MRKHSLVLLGLLRNEMARSLLPAISDSRLQGTLIMASKLITKELVNLTAAQDVEREAAADLAKLLPRLAELLGEGAIGQLNMLREVGRASWQGVQAQLQSVITSLVARDTPDADAIVKEIVGIEARLRAKLEERYQSSIEVAPLAKGHWDPSVFDEADQARLAAYLRRRFPQDSALTVTGAKPLAGGFSKQTVIIDLAGNTTLPKQVVIRREAPFTTSGGDLLSEFAVLNKMYAAGVPVAQPFDLEADRAVFATRFMTTSRVHGTNIGDSMVVQHNPAVSADLARSVALLHSVDPTGLEDVLPGGRVTPRERLRAELEYDNASWDGLAHFKSAGVKGALQWLSRNLHLADGPAVIVHRDLGMHNILVQDDRIAAILDWETVSFGIREDDLGLLYRAVRHMDDWNTFIGQYEAASGQSVDRAKLNYFVLAGLVRMAVLVARIGNAMLEGEMDGIPLMYVGECISDFLNEAVCEVFETILSGRDIA